jgi:hypothetical protein
MQHDDMDRVAERPAGESGAIPGEPRQVVPQAGDAARRQVGSIRADDTEPYVGLQYVARLFKVVAFLVLIALLLEMGVGVITEGTDALVPLIAEAVQLGVLSAILWGAADVTLLLIDIGHDVRAARVLLGRISARGEAEFEGERRERKRM